MTSIENTMFKVFSVDGGRLAEDICYSLSAKMDIPPVDLIGELKIVTFSDGEISPQFMESVRDQKVFLVSSTITPQRILTLLLAIDAAKRASASEVIAIIPYFGYSRQDRREGSRGAIGAKLMADMIQTAGADQLISIDLHSEQIQGFFDMPVNMIPGHIAFWPFSKSLPNDEYVVCSPDAGGVKRANKFYHKFLQRFPDTNFAMLSKLRDKPNSIERMDLIGDVAGRHVIIVDDMVDTAGTLTNAARILKENGASRVTAIIAHGVLSGLGHERIEKSEWLDKLIITDSIQQIENPKIEVVSCAPAIAAAVMAIVSSASMDSHLERV
jgi:ribose-phosphate pyrophosphokinase